MARGVVTTCMLAEWRECSEEDNRLCQILRPKQGPNSPAWSGAGGLHLSTVGWMRVRAWVKERLEEGIRQGKAPATLGSFAEYERELLPLLAAVDRAIVAGGYEEDLGIAFPYLILTLGNNWRGEPYPLKRRSLIRVNHQGGGYCCTQREFQGIVLRPNEGALRLANELHARYDGGSCTAPPSWPTAQEYMMILRSHQLSCDVGYVEMQESVYPIGVEHAQALTDETLPRQLDRLIDWAAHDRAEQARRKADGEPNGRRHIWRSMINWHLYLVTENSD